MPETSALQTRLRNFKLGLAVDVKLYDALSDLLTLLSLSLSLSLPYLFLLLCPTILYYTLRYATPEHC